MLSITFAPSFSAEVSEQNQMESVFNDATIDVLVVDLPCSEFDKCEVFRPNHLVEYYGADWCEPCEPLELMLDNMDNETIAVIQHHPSIFDQTYLNYSKFRFEDQFRLIFIPSIVINSAGLLTGSGQGQELNQVLASSTINYSGIDDLSFSNGTVFWNTSTPYNLTIWKLESVEHEFDNRSLNHLAVDMKTLNNTQRTENLSSWVTNATSRLVFVLQGDDYQQLQSLSSNPTGDKNLNERQQIISELLEYDGGYDLAIITFLILLACLLPALISFRKLQKQVDNESE